MSAELCCARSSIRIRRHTGCMGRSKFRPRGGGKTGHCGGHWPRTCATKIPYETIVQSLLAFGTIGAQSLHFVAAEWPEFGPPSTIDEVKGLDPRHPLYGRSFRVLRRSTHRGGNFPPSYEVEYRNGSSLLIPVAATEWHDSPNDQIKLCIEALRELVCTVDCLDSHDEHKSKRSLDNTVWTSPRGVEG